jgi:hypothetical protein
VEVSDEEIQAINITRDIFHANGITRSLPINNRRDALI